MKKLLGKDFESYMKILKQKPVKSIRVNTLKISVSELKQRFKEKAWEIKQPFKKYPEIMIIESDLEPGELGKSLEHFLGYYYIQEIASMFPIIALQPKPNETFLDLCSSPGSKTTQAASGMKNTGTIIANEINFGRTKILALNLQRCGVINAIITRKEGLSFCEQMKKQGFQFDKILVDAPCSGEGTLRSTPKTFLMWNIKTISRLSRLQKNLVVSAWELLKPGGKLVYSTCTHAPEENEEVVDFILKKFNKKIKIENISLPVIPKQGITKWNNKKYLEDVKKACRIYPQDNNTEGFFVAKFKKLK
jgi:NOL1/NOP2/sun family putative RNA methylase